MILVIVSQHLVQIGRIDGPNVIHYSPFDAQGNTAHQKSLRLEHEPASEPLHISVKVLLTTPGAGEHGAQDDVGTTAPDVIPRRARPRLAGLRLHTSMGRGTRRCTSRASTTSSPPSTRSCASPTDWSIRWTHKTRSNRWTIFV